MDKDCGFAFWTSEEASDAEDFMTKNVCTFKDYEAVACIVFVSWSGSL